VKEQIERGVINTTAFDEFMMKGLASAALSVIY